jgi:hypothetical protein
LTTLYLASAKNTDKTITCYTLVGVFQIFVGHGCKHLHGLKELALCCDASVLQDLPKGIGRISKKLVKNWWTKHGLPFSKNERRNDPENFGARIIRFGVVVEKI